MEAVRTSETSVGNHFTRQYNPEDSSEQICNITLHGFIVVSHHKNPEKKNLMKQHCNERLKGMVTWKFMDKQHFVILLGYPSWSINYIAEMSGQQVH
jgi:hypothetical protein